MIGIRFPKAYALIEDADPLLLGLLSSTAQFQPNEHYRYAFKEGMEGWDVWAIQIAINAANKAGLVEDGIFGPRTKTAVINLQAALKITQDGICGVETQAVLCRREAARAEAQRVPTGLIRGLTEGESGNIVPATSVRYPDGSFDTGPDQKHLLNPTQAEEREAYNVGLEDSRIANETKAAYQSYFGKKGATTTKEAWRLAILLHNWPAAAEQIALGHKDTWVYTSRGLQYTLDDPAPWVKEIGVFGIVTGWQWAQYYINSKTIYITSWTVNIL
jgi:peptidoglycan hydrolase-like protein with peptidoglycan-binding domain